MQRPKILFVDDEPSVLEGLRRLFRPDRRRWDIDFATSAREALGKMGTPPCDVVVSDMRMPDMDGAELLQAVAIKFPQTIRFVLTGQAEARDIDRSLSVTHQFLAKPCAIDHLRRVLERSFELRAPIQNLEVLTLVAGLQTLPSMPMVFRTLHEVLSTEGNAIEDVARIIEHDVAVLTKLLQLSNSSLFEFPKPVISVTHAASLLGMTTLKGFVLAEGRFSELTAADPAGLALMERVGRHARAVAILSRRIAVDLDAPGLADIAFLSGLLHDVGQLVVFTASPSLYARIGERSVDEGLSFQAAMEAECGCTTWNIGAYLLGLWGIPDDIVFAVLNHRHAPTDAEAVCPATIVHIADRLVNEIDVIADLESPKPKPATSFPATCSDDHLTAWRALARQNSV